jgi:hypothetical protein
MPDKANILTSQIGVSLDFQRHVFKYLDIEAVEIINELLNDVSGKNKVSDYYYGNQICSIEFQWEKVEDHFTFLAIIKPQSEARIGEAYPYMLPPVYPSPPTYRSQITAYQDIPNDQPFRLHNIEPIGLTWIYVYTSHPAKSELMDGWLKEVEHLSEHLNTTEKLNALSKAAKDTISLEAWHGGLYLFGSLGLESIVPNVKEFKTYFGRNGKSPTVDFYGFLHYPLYFPHLTFHVPLGSNVGDGPVKLKEAFLELTSPTYYMPGQTEIGFAVELGIGEESFTIKALWPIGGDRIKASASIRGPIPFLDTTSIPGLGSFKPSFEIDMELDLSISEKSITRAKLELEVENWVLIENILVLEDLDFQITVLYPGTQNLVMASIQAAALLGSSGIRLMARGDYPSGQFSFRLDPATPIHINDLLGAFTGKHPALDEGLIIDQFEGWVNTKSGYASFSTGVSGSWVLKLGFIHIELKALHFNITKNEHWSFGVWATFDLNDIIFSVSALYNDGWFFSAKAQNVKLGSFFKKLSPDTSLPDAIESLELNELLFEFNTHSGDYQMGGKGMLLMNDTKIDAEILVKATNENGTKKTSFSGRLIIADKYFFDLSFQNDEPDTSMLMAAYHDDGKKALKLGMLLKKLGVNPAPDINIQVKDAVVVSRKVPGEIPGTVETNNLFISDIEGGINLSNLPLVGTLFQGSNSVKLAFHIQYASKAFDENAVTHINTALPAGIPKLIAKELDQGANGPANLGLSKGVGLAITMQIGEMMIPMDFPLKAGGNGKAAASNTTGSQTIQTKSTTLVEGPVLMEVAQSKAVQPPIKWFSIQKHIGPVYFNRMGISYAEGKFTFSIDASLSMSGLTLSLMGLSVTSGIEKFDPHFGLTGLGLSFVNGPLEIGGSFLREQVNRNGELVDEYSGTAIIRTEAFSLMAMGGYTTIDGHPSLFLYAILDKSIGGPSFFFVEGLAAGFGYNRKLIIPSIDQIEHFPLITAARAGVPSTVDPTAALQSLRTYIPPSTGDIFLAIGVKFNSFKQVHSFALLTLSFGHKVELHLLGISNLLVPSEIEPGQSPVARVEMVLSGTYIPEEGFLGIQTQLTSNSYILSEKCRLTGGFAFFSWFSGEHAGDYIVTLGGYHPEFVPPAHYPQHVPRLGFNWSVDSHTTIKGDAYYALCSHAFMVGGHLEATYHSGAFTASFKAGADFLISWQPYHYDAHIYVDISASYTYHFFGTHHISVGLGADIHLSGPEFGGTAKVHIWVVSISVNFGQGMGAPKPIDWEHFKTSFLPAPDKILSANINHGLVSATKELNYLGVVNPKKFQITIESVIPSTEIRINNDKVENVYPTKFGIGSMGLGLEDIDSSTMEIFIEEISDLTIFKLNPLLKKVPSAIWGPKLKPSVNDDSFIEDALMGLEISLEEPPEGPGTNPLRRSDLIGGDPTEISDSFYWENNKMTSMISANTFSKNIDYSKNRLNTLSFLELKAETDLTEFNPADYLFN